VCDVRDRQAARDLITDLDRGSNGIDVLVNNAGVIQVGPLELLTEADFDDAMNTMFWGAVVPTLAVLNGMRRRRKGMIVNITSVGGKVPVPHMMPYTSAKFAAVGFSEALSQELAGSGVHVLTVVPGLMRTGSFLNAFLQGRKSAEFTWFSLGSSLPLVSTDAESAARRIVKATLNRERELILTPLANLGVRVHGTMPGITSTIMSLVSRVMPSSRAGGIEQERGDHVMQSMNSRGLERALSWGMNAAEQFQPVESVRRAKVREHVSSAGASGEKSNQSGET
jgi:short-subunit dehydrogenase